MIQVLANSSICSNIFQVRAYVLQAVSRCSQCLQTLPDVPRCSQCLQVLKLLCTARSDAKTGSTDMYNHLKTISIFGSWRAPAWTPFQTPTWTPCLDPNLGPTWAQLGAILGLTWAQLGPNLGARWAQAGFTKPKIAHEGPLWLKMHPRAEQLAFPAAKHTFCICLVYDIHGIFF